MEGDDTVRTLNRLLPISGTLRLHILPLQSTDEPPTITDLKMVTKNLQH